MNGDYLLSCGFAGCHSCSSQSLLFKGMEHDIDRKIGAMRVLPGCHVELGTFHNPAL